MAGLILPSRFTRQPQGAIGANRGHPLAQHLSALYLGGNGLPRDVLGSSHFDTAQGSPAATSNAFGIAYGNRSSGTPLSAPDKVNAGATPPAFTYIFVGEFFAVGGAFAGLFGRSADAAGTGAAGTLQSTGSGAYYIYNGANQATTVGLTSSLIVNVGPVVVAISYDGTNVRTYVNGVPKDVLALAAPPGGTGGRFLLFSEINQLTAYSVAGICNAFIPFNVTLTDAQVLAVSQNPWQLFAPPVRKLWLSTASGSGAIASGAPTEGADTSSGSAVLTAVASGTPVEAGDSSAGAGLLTAAASGTPTEGADASAGSAALTAIASGSPTEGPDASAGSATAGSSASGSPAEGPDTSSGSATLTAVASGAPTEGPDTSAGTGSTGSGMSGAPVEGPDTSAGAAVLTAICSGTPTESPDSSAATVTLGALLSGAAIEAADLSAGFARLMAICAGSPVEGVDLSSGVLVSIDPSARPARRTTLAFAYGSTAFVLTGGMEDES